LVMVGRGGCFLRFIRQSCRGVSPLDRSFVTARRRRAGHPVPVIRIPRTMAYSNIRAR